MSGDPMKFKTSIYPWFVCGLGALFYCYEYLLRMTPSVMAGPLMQHYALTGAAFGNLIGFYYYAYTPMQLPVGILMDRFGPRLLLAVASLTCAVGSFMFAMTDWVWFAGIGRFLVGFGSAFAFVGVLKLATIWLPANRFALIAGLATSLGMVGASFGDFILPVMTQYWGWKLTIYIPAAAGILLAWIIWMLVHEGTKVNIHRLEYKTATMSAVLQGLWGAIKNIQIWYAGIIGAVLYISNSVIAEAWGVTFLQEARGLSNLSAAHVNSMIFFGWAFGGPLMGYISDKLKRRCLPLFFGAVMSAALIAVLLYVPHLSLAMLYIIFLLFGVVASTEVIVFAVAREYVGKQVAGSAIALTNMLIMAGGAVLQPLLGYLLDRGWDGTIANGVHVFSAQDFEHALAFLPISLIAVAVLSLVMRETYGTPQISE